MRFPLLPILAALLLASCSVSNQLESSARRNVLSEDVLRTAHVGISVFEPATGQYWFNYQGDKYFVPASNTKIPTCYAAMKYLGDSLVGLRYKIKGHVLAIKPSGDPTFLHPDFPFQPALSLIKNTGSEVLLYDNNTVEPFGSGWSWNDYDQSYLPERNAMPIYGNVVWLTDKPRYPPFYLRDTIIGISKTFGNRTYWILPEHFAQNIIYDTLSTGYRKQWENQFYIRNSSGNRQIPFITNGLSIARNVLKEISGKDIKWGSIFMPELKEIKLHSQPTDSLLKPMMHSSDNFFAEQSLLMASNEFLGFMNDNKIIDTLLKTDFADLPQKPRWVDGSGLSRYNLFTPQDFIAILHKMKKEFGMERIKEIFPTGGEGTLSSYYKKDSTFIYAKTGTLSGVVALSGFLYTKGGKELIFSVLVNNHNGSATAVRRAVEKFIQGIRERY